MENSKLFISAEAIIAGYKKTFLWSLLANLVLTLFLIYFALHAKDRDVIYVSGSGVEHQISDQLQAKLHAEWMIRDLFEVDAYSINRKHHQSKALGDVSKVLANMKESRVSEDIINQRLSYSVTIDSLVVVNKAFPYDIHGSFHRVNSKNLAANYFSFRASVHKTSVSTQNPLGLKANNVVINIIR